MHIYIFLLYCQTCRYVNMNLVSRIQTCTLVSPPMHIIHTYVYIYIYIYIY